MLADNHRVADNIHYVNNYGGYCIVNGIETLLIVLINKHVHF